VTIDADQFLDVVMPPLRSGHASALASAVRARWTQTQVASLLSSKSVDTRRCAALVLGLIGDNAAVGPLSRLLHDDDGQVHQMAEHAMWSIWFRGCGCDGIEPFERGARSMAHDDYDQAIGAFTQAIECCPQFAEAYNQRAMAWFFRGKYTRSAEDCKRALKLMPAHFGAAAGLGHCLCHLGDLPGALEAYRKAIDINPRMPGIDAAIQRIESRLAPTQPKSAAHPRVANRSR